MIRRRGVPMRGQHPGIRSQLSGAVLALTLALQTGPDALAQAERLVADADAVDGEAVLERVWTLVDEAFLDPGFNVTGRDHNRGRFQFVGLLLVWFLFGRPECFANSWKPRMNADRVSSA